MKEAVTRGLDLPLPEALALESRLARRLLATAEAREGIAAHLAGREGRFLGA
jgi:enoyl-CoA hydratase/carnithine racemase